MTIETGQYCTFLIGDHHVGIPVDRVQEVLPTWHVTPVPLSLDSVLGVINLRGQIVTTIDLRHRLDWPESNSQRERANIVVHAARETVGFVVDAVSDIVRVSRAEFELPPETITDASRALIVGCYKMTNYLLFVLDVDKASCPA